MTDKMAKVRAKKKPPVYKNIHPSVKKLSDTETLSLKNVKLWEKHNKDRVKTLKLQIRRMNKGKDQNKLINEMHNRQTYLHNITRYFDTGVWCDLFYGKDQEKKMLWRTLAYAYDAEGYVKKERFEIPRVG